MKYFIYFVEVEPVYNENPWGPNLWPLLTGGCYSTLVCLNFRKNNGSVLSMWRHWGGPLSLFQIVLTCSVIVHRIYYRWRYVQDLQICSLVQNVEKLKRNKTSNRNFLKKSSVPTYFGTHNNNRSQKMRNLS
jgi:hypothetical protein